MGDSKQYKWEEISSLELLSGVTSKDTKEIRDKKVQASIISFIAGMNEQKIIPLIICSVILLGGSFAGFAIGQSVIGFGILVFTIIMCGGFFGSISYLRKKEKRLLNEVYQTYKIVDKNK